MKRLDWPFFSHLKIHICTADCNYNYRPKVLSAFLDTVGPYFSFKSTCTYGDGLFIRCVKMAFRVCRLCVAGSPRWDARLGGPSTFAGSRNCSSGPGTHTLYMLGFISGEVLILKLIKTTVKWFYTNSILLRNALTFYSIIFLNTLLRFQKTSQDKHTVIF